MSILYFFADFLYLLLRLIRFRETTIIENISIAFPKYTDEQKQALKISIYKHFSKLIFEDIALLSLSKEKLLSKCRIYNLHLVENIQETMDVGFFVLTGHFGNWEFGLAALAEKGFAANAVVKEIKGQLGQAFVDKMRSKHNVGTILRSENAGRQILQKLKAKEAIGFVLDQNMTISEGVFVDFFNKPACTMPGLAVLNKRAKAPIVPIRFERAEDGILDIWILPPVINNSENSDVLYLTQLYSHKLEEIIRLAPAQWLWMHKRWRTKNI